MKVTVLDGSRGFAHLRERAERMLAGGRVPCFTVVPNDMAKLVHELQLHRTELEVQNDELRETQLQLLDAHQRYRELYDAAPVAYITLDPRGRMIEVNRAASALLAAPRRALLNTPFSRFLPHADAERFHVHQWEVLTAGEHRSTEIDLQRSDGVRLALRVESSAVITSIGTECQCALIDITTQQRTERRLADREHELSVLLEAVADGVLRIDGADCVGWASAGAGHLLGCPRAALIGRRIDDLIAELTGRDRDVQVTVRRLDERSRVALLTKRREPVFR